MGKPGVTQVLPGCTQQNRVQHRCKQFLGLRVVPIPIRTYAHVVCQCAASALFVCFPKQGICILIFFILKCHSTQGCRKSRHFVLGLPPAVNTLPPAPTHSPVFRFFAVSHNSSRTHQDCSMCSHLDNAWHWHERALALCRSPHFSALSTHFHLFLCSHSA